MNTKSVSGSQLSATKRSSDWTSGTSRVSRYLATTSESRLRQTLSLPRPAASASRTASAKWRLAISDADIGFLVQWLFERGDLLQPVSDREIGLPELEQLGGEHRVACQVGEAHTFLGPLHVTLVAVHHRYLRPRQGTSLAGAAPGDLDLDQPARF